MPKFRKKPVVIDAVQIGGDIAPILAFAGDSISDWDAFGVAIDTLEGTMRGQVGDWIIKGVNGEFNPCKDEIFRKTYEPAEDA